MLNPFKSQMGKKVSPGNFRNAKSKTRRVVSEVNPKSNIKNPK